MSDHSAIPPRPVSLIVTLFVLALSAVFLVVVWRFYKPSSTAPQNQVAEGLPLMDPQTKKPSDVAWKATPETRRAALAALRKKQADQAASYAWVDQKAGVVQLPIDRAMELVVQQYGSKP